MINKSKIVDCDYRYWTFLNYLFNMLSIQRYILVLLLICLSSCNSQKEIISNMFVCCNVLIHNTINLFMRLNNKKIMRLP